MNDKNASLHPITQVTREIYNIFKDIGFDIAEGPEIETEYYNFDTLNVPADHPARDMWDTFWLKPLSDRKLLRTHTSPVQIRYMETHKPTKDNPIRIIAPGKVFRNEATDATHEAQFFQLEGLVVGENISLADLKGTLDYFFKKLLGEKAEVRFRPSFFPFVEPGVEIDVWFNNKWMEIMGAGMVHPSVLESVGLHPNKYKGFAFGGGVDRLVMAKFGITDVRMLYTGDLRLINQF
jgi:phenylalanyl-tRNA synthetase alpha chain